MPELNHQILEYAGGVDGTGDVPPFYDWANEAKNMNTDRAAWKEAFLATRAYYSNNNGENSKRHHEAVKRLKEMRLIK